MESTPRMPGSFYQELDNSQIWQTSTNGSRPPLRKRPRIATEPTEFSHSTPYQPLHDSSTTFELASPSPLANSNYRLAGGLDTPGIWEAQNDDYLDDLEGEQDHRPSRYNPTGRRDTIEASNIQSYSSTEIAAGWSLGRTAWALTGGLAGKIFNFCWKGSFSGFAAGGGPAYNLNVGTSEMLNHAVACTSSETSDVFSSHYEAEFIPGTFQEYPPGTEAKRRNDTLTPTQSKRNNFNDDSIDKGSWILVERGQDADDVNSPARKRSKASSAGSASRWQPTRQSLNVSSPGKSNASYASPRSRTLSTAFANQRRSNGSPLPSRNTANDATQRKRVRASMASSHKRQSSTGMIPHSPLSPEIESYQKQKRKDERKHDESLRRLNEQLQDMIREGKEALGAKVEVIDDDNTHSDEGYFEDGR